MNFLRKYVPKKLDKPLTAAFCVLGLMALFMDWAPRVSKEAVPEIAEPVEVDTMIPAGFLLVPIQLANGESLASLAGAFALIDLYSVSENGRKGFKVATGVKLVRAPLNPEQFAVLVREEESSKLLRLEGPFFAALKNPKDVARPAAVKALRSPFTIHYGEAR